MSAMHDEADFESRLWSVVNGAHDAPVERHLATCNDCQAEVFTMRQLMQFLATTGGGFSQPPDSVLVQASALMRRIRPDLLTQPASFGLRLRERMRVFTASLILDTGLTPQVAGLRGGGDRRIRQFAFVSDVADLDLEVSPLEGGYSVAGQLGMDVVPANLSIRFVPADQDPLAETSSGVLETALSEYGYFTLTITAGHWVAAVEIDDAVILFPGVQL